MPFRRYQSHENQSGQYPPLYYSRLRSSARGWRNWFAVFTPLTIVTIILFVWDWGRPLSFLGPCFGAVWLYSLIVMFASRHDDAIAYILPYFPKSAPHVEADTFLHGHALARNFQNLEEWASAHGVPPLSTFGWNDDLYGQTVVWHPAEHGLETIACLLENPELSIEVRADLARIEMALRHAQHVGSPFCLLLRHGNTTSGAEMDARQGNFGGLSAPQVATNLVS